MAKATLNPLTEAPTNKTQITKAFMIAYITSGKATPEQIKEFKKVVKDNQKEFTSKLTNKTYEDIDIKAVREKFCDMFFPQLNIKKVKKGKSFTDIILEL